jgi:transcriptional regulator with XRE-family HTH domain
LNRHQIRTMNITINPELRAYIDPLTVNEYQALERSILAEGCRDALVLWGEVLIDGHNRYAICQQHGIAFNTTQNTRFANIEDVMLWMIDNHLARRSVSDFQRGMLALRKKEIVASRNQAKEDNPPKHADADADTPPLPSATQAREELAKTAGISSNTVTQIEKIRRAATPELVDAVRAGTISINAAATVASLTPEQQVTAVTGGKKELQLAAKQVREMKSANKPLSLKVSNAPPAVGAEGHADSHPYHEKIATLTAENTLLKEKIAELSMALEAARASQDPD